MDHPQRAVRWLVASALLAGFFAYYFHLTQYLSFNGGPDEEPHYQAAKFIAEHGRLAVYPDDEPKLYFSSHGTTRSFRPPLAYVTGAIGSRILDKIGVEEVVPYRVGSALFGALGVTLVFLSAVAVTGSAWLGLFGAMSFGLMPQFAFLSAYFNDDVGAVMAVALLLYSLVMLTLHGVSRKNLVFTGIAIGVVTLSKPSAWVAAAGLMVAVLWQIVRSNTAIGRGLLLIAVVATAVSGWWLLFNMYHHGIHDPVNLGVEQELSMKHRDLAAGTGRSYSAQGIGALELLGNRGDFMTKTFKSTVGNLDWLRLEMGPLQYGFYGLLFVISLIGWLYGLFGKDATTAGSRTVIAILLTAVVLQFATYVWVNLYRDAQPQGRYLLPAMPIVMLMMSFGIRRIMATLRTLAPRGLPGAGILRTSAACLLLAAPVYVHLQGFVHHVLPFYRFPYYYGLTAQSFTPWPANWGRTVETNQLEIKLQKGAVHVRSSGTDPWMLLPREFANTLAGGVMLRITLESEANGSFSVYWDEGGGMSEATSGRRHYNIGYQTIYLKLDTRHPRLMRLDPLDEPGRLTIYEIAIAPIRQRPLNVTGFVRRLLSIARPAN